jgi:UDP-galactopyranose mutase
MFDYLIVGAGFAGSVLAERLARGSGKKVLLVDRRNHIGGNAYDCFDDAGVLIHKYGPHIFHTASKEVFDYLTRFTEWRQYQHKVLASVDGQLVPIPINLDTINRLYGLELNSFQLEEWFASRAEKKDVCKTSEDVVVNKVGRELYEKFFKGYTRKQWGLDPSELDAQVTARVPTRTNRDDRYFTDAYQAMPKFGFTRMFQKMLDHPNIKVLLNTDYREVSDFVPYRELIFTGPVDEFFECRYGKLPYRCLEFKHETINKEWVQPVAVINYPNDYAYTRVTEFKHLTGQEHQKTSIVYEFSCAEGDPYYPIPRAENAELYKKYAALAEATPNVHFVGRLATYRYYNMDQVVAQALTTYAKIVGLSRQEAVELQTEPRSKRFHLALNGGLITAGPNGNGNGHHRNGNGNGHRNGNGIGNGNGHSAHNGENGNGTQKLVSNGNGNGHNHH